MESKYPYKKHGAGDNDLCAIGKEVCVHNDAFDWILKLHKKTESVLDLDCHLPALRRPHSAFD